MKQNINVINFAKELDYEDIICILNPLQSIDLKQILLMTHEDRRLEVALSFSGISVTELFDKIGISSYHRWTKYTNRLPMGIAFRLAKVFGVSAEILFSSPKWQGEAKNKS
jgi:hypothetical protein